MGDEAKRKKYDEFRSLQARGGFGPGMGGGVGGAGGGFGGGGFNLDDLLRDRGAAGGGLGDMFGDLFGGAPRGRTQQQARPRRGADVESTATIGFTDALDGVTVSLRLTSDAACPTCQGTGGKPGTRPHICPECEGAGFIVAGTGGAFSINETCPRCGGRQARVRRGLPDLPRQRPRHLGAHHPGPDPGGGEGRREDPAEGQGCAR